MQRMEPEFILIPDDPEAKHYCTACRKWRDISAFTIKATGVVNKFCDHCRELRKHEDHSEAYRRSKKYYRKRIEAAERKGLIYCKLCRRDLEPDAFRTRANGLMNKHCKECCRKQADIVAQPDKAARYQKKHGERLRQMREDVIKHYGGACSCCGEMEITFLQLDHINDDGGKHRAVIGVGGTALVQWLHTNNYPEGIVQVMCANCHLAKTRKVSPCPCQNWREYESESINQAYSLEGTLAPLLPC